MRFVWFHHISPHYLTNGTLFGGKKLLNKKSVCRFSLTTSVWTVYNSTQNYARYFHEFEHSSCKIAVILVIFSWRQNFHDRFSRIPQAPNFMKSGPVRAAGVLLHADGRTDWRTERHAESISFSNFANAPENLRNQDNVFVSVDKTLCLLFIETPSAYNKSLRVSVNVPEPLQAIPL